MKRARLEPKARRFTEREHVATISPPFATPRHANPDRTPTQKLMKLIEIATLQRSRNTEECKPREVHDGTWGRARFGTYRSRAETTLFLRSLGRATQARGSRALECTLRLEARAFGPTAHTEKVIDFEAACTHTCACVQREAAPPNF